MIITVIIITIITIITIQTIRRRRSIQKIRRVRIIRRIIIRRGIIGREREREREGLGTCGELDEQRFQAFVSIVVREANSLLHTKDRRSGSGHPLYHEGSCVMKNPAGD